MNFSYYFRVFKFCLDITEAHIKIVIFLIKIYKSTRFNLQFT